MTKIIQTRMQHSSPDTKTKNTITNKQQQNNQYNTYTTQILLFTEKTRKNHPYNTMKKPLIN